MKILMQDGSAIVTIRRDCWAVLNGKDNYSIIRNGSDEFLPYLGSYPTEERAREVLNEIFQLISDGKSTYEMPLK
ncbi:hypothetical protein [[Clostridium] fimetarium]|uniref:Uncharacterized protein n=1 Tax=[Clostridium] fimetarium TaxID=99656 RepID=A0A1I0M0K6_9FIRM|nr:hypothetical protein [[Clostridium] fimetarium]SEV81627.1 hypothetical protein SAMN05421659_10129 [[Clostridium] fimetarium]